MASKEIKVEKCVAQKKDVKNGAKIDTFENSDSTPKKENVEIVGCMKSMEKMDDIVAGAGTESTPPPTDAKQHEKFAPIEDSACSKVKMADGGGNFSSMELTPPIVTTIHQFDSIVQRSANVSCAAKCEKHFLLRVNEFCVLFNRFHRTSLCHDAPVRYAEDCRILMNRLSCSRLIWSLRYRFLSLKSSPR